MTGRRRSALAVLTALAACGESPTPPPVPPEEVELPTPHLAVLSGDGVTDTIDATLADPVVIEAVDSTGAPLPGIALRFESIRLGSVPTVLLRYGGVAPRSELEALTGPDGRISVGVSLGPIVGTAAFRVTHAGSGAWVSAFFEVRPGNPVELTLQPFDTTVTIGRSFRYRPMGRDRVGNLIEPEVVWEVEGPISVSGGTASGLAVGSGSVRATAAGLTADAFLVVLPGGRILAERWGGGQVRASNVDGTDLEIVTVNGTSVRVDAAPSGNHATFSNGRLHYANVPGGSVRILNAAMVDMGAEYWPQFSHDGQWIYFEASWESFNPGREVWRVTPSGLTAERVTATRGTSRRDHHPSPDHSGTRLSLAVDSDAGGPEPAMLHVLELATGQLSPLGQPALSSRWSPDDSWIAFVGPEWTLNRIRPDGSGHEALTSAYAQFGNGFDWSPDGEFIIGTTPQGDPQLLVLETGEIISLPLGKLGSVAWYDDPN